MQRRLFIDKAHTALDIFRFAVFFIKDTELWWRVVKGRWLILVSLGFTKLLAWLTAGDTETITAVVEWVLWPWSCLYDEHTQALTLWLMQSEPIKGTIDQLQCWHSCQNYKENERIIWNAEDLTIPLGGTQSEYISNINLKNVFTTYHDHRTSSFQH